MAEAAWLEGELHDAGISGDAAAAREHRTKEGSLRSAGEAPAEHGRDATWETKDDALRGTGEDGQRWLGEANTAAATGTARPSQSRGVWTINISS